MFQLSVLPLKLVAIVIYHQQCASKSYELKKTSKHLQERMVLYFSHYLLKFVEISIL